MALLMLSASALMAEVEKLDFRAIPEVRILRGESDRSLRDVAAIYHEGVFHVYLSLVEPEADGSVFWYTAHTESRDLVHWSELKKLTPRDQNLNFSSPGNVIRFRNEWILCLQTYPIPDCKISHVGKQTRYANENARLWIMRSPDLRQWGKPEMLRVIPGCEKPFAKGMRMIDPYLIEDVANPGLWWCFFKRHGEIQYSTSRDLVNWEFKGRSGCIGENPTVLRVNGEYVLVYSPANGMNLAKSKDLHHWEKIPGLITLGQKDWEWGKRGRLSAATVIDCRANPEVGKFVMFFHCTKVPEQEGMYNHCSIGIAWSDDLKTWEWPGKSSGNLATTRAVSADETRLLQGEIDRLAAAGGGTLRVRSGVHRSGALFFKPGVNLHLEKGAVILGVDDDAAYPWCETRMIGTTLNYYPALINADRCDGFTITGEGVIDGHGLPVWKAFWPRHRAAFAKKKPWDDVFNGLTRPRVLYVSNSRNVDVSGVTFKNSKFWTTHYYRCENVTVHDCRIVAEKLNGVVGPSTDAIDIDVCTNVSVRRVYMNVNDDAVVVKGGLGPEGDKVEKGNGGSTNVLVEDCTFGSMCHACMTLGSECPAARNIRMRNCRIEGAHVLACVKMRADTPQHLTDLMVENCTGRCDRFMWIRGITWNGRWPDYAQHPIPSVLDRLEFRGNKIDCRLKYDCQNEPWLTLKEYVEEDNTINAKNIGNPGCTRSAKREP